MKNFTLAAIIMFSSFCALAQGPCPDVNSSIVVAVSTNPACSSKVVFNAQNTTNKARGVKVQVYYTADYAAGTGTPFFEGCQLIPANTGFAQYESAAFANICGADLTYVVTSYTAANGDCQGGDCATVRQGIGAGVLPVKLLSFYGVKNQNGILLTWQTASEYNIKEYIVQKSTGAGFATVINVAAKNSSLSSDYTATDNQLSPATTQYRLKIVDIDGSSTYSNVIIIKGSSSVSNVDIYPNPAVVGNAKLKITDITDITNIQVYDLSGKILRNISVTNNQINMGDLKAGSYLLKMINAKTGGSATKQFIILN